MDTLDTVLEMDNWKVRIEKVGEVTIADGGFPVAYTIVTAHVLISRLPMSYNNHSTIYELIGIDRGARTITARLKNR